MALLAAAEMVFGALCLFFDEAASSRDNLMLDSRISSVLYTCVMR